MRKEILNRKEKIVTGIAAGILLLLLAGGGLLVYRTLSGNANDPAKVRLNTLTLVHSYVEKEEFDRALSLLDNLLIKNPDDKDASELLDAVLAAKKAKLALESGNGSENTAELKAALEAARQAASRIAAAADEAQRAASRIANSEKETGRHTVSVDNRKAASAASLKQQEDDARAAVDSKAEAERQQKEQAAADEAKRKAMENELAQKNERIQKQINQVNAFIAKGKDAAASGSLRSALSNFEQAAAALPEGEKEFAAQKYEEMAESLYAISQSATDSTVKNEALASALEYANQAAQADPALAAARYLRSKIYTDQKKNDLALAELKEAVRLDPKNYLYAYELGKMYYLQRRFEEARQCFTTVNKLAPKFEPAFFNLGLTDKALSDTSGSLAAFRQATVIKTDYVRAYIEIARLLDRKGDFSGSIANYNTALKYEPGNVSALREMASIYSKTGKFAEAERFFKEALTLGSNDAQTNYNMATVQLALDKPVPALDYAKKAVDSESTNAVYLYTYGLAGERNGMKDVALQQYAKSIAADPKYVKPRINLGNMYIDAKRIDDAINQLSAAYNIEKDNFEVNNNLGKAYGLKGMFDKSVDHYAKAVAKNPKDVEVRANLATSYISAGLSEKARDTYVDLLKLDPSRWDAYYELGKLYISLGDKVAAKAVFQDLLKKKPDYTRAAEVQSLLGTL